MKRGFQIGVILLFTCVTLSLVGAHSVQINPYNQTSADGSVFFDARIGIDPWSNESTYRITLELLPLQNQTNTGDLFCTFDLNTSSLVGCTGMQLTPLPFDEVNSTTNTTSNSTIIRHDVFLDNNGLGEINITTGNATEVNGTQEYPNNDQNGTANQTSLWSRYLITVNKSGYESGDYNLSITLEDLNKSSNSTTIGFNFPASKPEPSPSIIIEQVSGHGCTTSWSCSQWGSCTNGLQARECAKIRSNCNPIPFEKPAESQTCTVTVETSNAINEPAVQRPLLSRITGAVVGAPTPVKFTGALIFIGMLVLGFVYVRARVNRLPHEK